MAELTNTATSTSAFGGRVTEPHQTPEEKTAVSKPQTFDDILGNREYQAEFDKRVSKAIETAKNKWNEEFDKRLTHELKEAEKLAKMCPPRKNRHKIATKNGMNRNNSFIFVEAGAFIPRFA